MIAVFSVSPVRGPHGVLLQSLRQAPLLPHVHLHLVTITIKPRGRVVRYTAYSIVTSIDLLLSIHIILIQSKFIFLLNM